VHRSLIGPIASLVVVEWRKIFQCCESNPYFSALQPVAGYIITKAQKKCNSDKTIRKKLRRSDAQNETNQHIRTTITKE
jgi:hypothetical protein